MDVEIFILNNTFLNNKCIIGIGACLYKVEITLIFVRKFLFVINKFRRICYISYKKISTFMYRHLNFKIFYLYNH